MKKNYFDGEDGKTIMSKVRYEKKLSILNLPGYPYMYTWCLGKQP